MSGGGARTPFALTDVRLSFASDKPLVLVKAGEKVPTIKAEIAYNGALLPALHIFHNRRSRSQPVLFKTIHYFWLAGALNTASSTATLTLMSVNLRVAGLNTS